LQTFGGKEMSERLEGMVCDYCHQIIEDGQMMYVGCVPGTDIDMHAHKDCRDADTYNILHRDTK
jgi:hypothetical protein